MVRLRKKLPEANGDIEWIDCIDLSIARMKPISAQWIVRLPEYLQSNPGIIILI